MKNGIIDIKRKYYKVVFPFFVFFFLCQFSFGQNLVPNPSFEIYDTCPSNENQVQYSMGWSSYSQAGTTPDYYNACDTGGPFRVPGALYLHQDAYDGHAYAAVVTWYRTTSFLYREHIGIQLSQPLVIGHKYFLSFYTTTGEGSQTIPSNKIGILLSMVEYNPNNPAPINNFAHLYSSAIITDTNNWIHVTGSFIADSAYNYCIVGNFFDNDHTDTINNVVHPLYSYYAVDMICISTDSLTCNGGATLDGITNPENNITLTIYPNPTLGSIFIEDLQSLPYELSVYDELGSLIIRRIIYDSRSNINLEKYANGIYLLKLNVKDKIYIKKIIKY